MTTITTINKHVFKEENILIQYGYTYGFWKLLWYWLIRKDIIRDKVYKITSVKDNTITLE